MFGRYDDYVISYKELTEKNELLEVFKKLVRSENEVKERLHSFIPEYRKQLSNAIEKHVISNKENERPFEICSKEICSGCSACANICPVKAIDMVDKKPVINRDKCIRCFFCQEFCPVGAMKAHKNFIVKILTK